MEPNERQPTPAVVTTQQLVDCVRALLPARHQGRTGIAFAPGGAIVLQAPSPAAADDLRQTAQDLLARLHRRGLHAFRNIEVRAENPDSATVYSSAEALAKASLLGPAPTLSALPTKLEEVERLTSSVRRHTPPQFHEAMLRAYKKGRRVVVVCTTPGAVKALAWEAVTVLKALRQELPWVVGLDAVIDPTAETPLPASRECLAGNPHAIAAILRATTDSPLSAALTRLAQHYDNQSVTGVPPAVDHDKPYPVSGSR